MAHCTACGYEARAQTRFCTQCGASLALDLPAIAPERNDHSATDSLAVRGLPFASTPGFGAMTIDGARVAAKIREVALSERARGAPVHRGDLAARQAQAMLQTEMPIACRAGLRRAGDGRIDGWDRINGSRADLTCSVYAEASLGK